MIDACITTTGKHGMEKCEISKGCIIPQENKETSQKLLKSDDYGNDLIRSILEMGMMHTILNPFIYCSFVRAPTSVQLLAYKYNSHEKIHCSNIT